VHHHVTQNICEEKETKKQKQPHRHHRTTSLLTNEKEKKNKEQQGLPPFLARKAFVEKREHLGDVELHVLKIEILLIVFLHLQQIVEFQVKFEKSAIAACCRVSGYRL
jgi:hypothetical protein